MIIDSVWFVAVSIPLAFCVICVWVVAFLLFCTAVGAMRRAWLSRPPKDLE